MPAPPVTNRQREEMRRLRAQGASLEEIGAALGRSGRCVLDHVRDMDVRCRPGAKGIGSDGQARLLAAADRGVPHEELAARFGLAKASIGPTLSRLRRKGRVSSATSAEARTC